MDSFSYLCTQNNTNTTNDMKKTLTFLTFAAMLWVGILLTGCDSEQMEKIKEVTEIKTVTVSLDENTEKTFAVGDRMAIVYKKPRVVKDRTATTVSTRLLGKDITNDGKTATFTFALVNPDKTEEVTYIYPAEIATLDGEINYDTLSTQDGMLETVNNRLFLAGCTEAWNDTLLPTCTLTNQCAILALSLWDAEEDYNTTYSTNSVTIKDGRHTYNVKSIDSRFAQKVIYVAIAPVTALLEYRSSFFEVTYRAATPSKTYEAGEVYDIIVMMALEGQFSVAPGKKVIFSPGNLQAKFSPIALNKPQWQFAPNQYDCVGNAKANTVVGDNKVTSEGIVDLFGWVGASSSLAAYGINSNTKDNAYGKHAGEALKSDWSVPANAASLDDHNDWFTLTEEQCEYLFTKRGRASQSYGNGKVNGQNGLILLPDSYLLPDELTFVSGTSDWVNEYTLEQWALLEAGGAVFLPAAGDRVGKEVKAVGEKGYYWTSTSHPSISDCAEYFVFTANTLNPAHYSSRKAGRSVRLVRYVK